MGKKKKKRCDKMLSSGRQYVKLLAALTTGDSVVSAFVNTPDDEYNELTTILFFSCKKQTCVFLFQFSYTTMETRRK